MKKFTVMLVLFLLLFHLPAFALASQIADAEDAVTLARGKIAEFDPCFGVENQHRYRYRAEQIDQEWKVTVTIPNDLSTADDNMVDFYVLTFSSQGEMTDVQTDPLLLSLEGGFENQFLALRRLTAEYGPWYSWTMEQRIDFEAKYSNDSYRMPRENDLSEAEALKIAREALQEATGKSDEEMDALYAVANLNKNDSWWSGQWTVLFYEPDQPRTGFGTAYPNQVQIANPTGDVVQIFISGEGNG